MSVVSPRRPVRGPVTTFSALRSPNYRLWFFGQTFSLMGTWMQSVAQGWVVYQMTASQLALGAVSFLNSIPSLFLMLPAGALLDRLPRRRVLLTTQTIMMLLAFVLAGLSASGTLKVWHIGVLAMCLGITQSFDAPCRQAMVVELVEDRGDLMNAIALNSSMFNLARVVGPAVGGIVLARAGATWCFVLNGFSFVAVLVALSKMRMGIGVCTTTRGRLRDELVAGLRYVVGNAQVRTLLLIVGVSTLLNLTYPTLMPAYAADVLHVGEAGLGSLNAALGFGALVGSLTLASLGAFKRKGLLLTIGNLLFPVMVMVMAVSPSYHFSLGCLPLVGISFVAQNSTVNALIQSLVPDGLRGRVMAVYMLMLFGASPFAALQAGSLAQLFGVRWGLAIGPALALAFALSVMVTVPSLRRIEA